MAVMIQPGNTVKNRRQLYKPRSVPACFALGFRERNGRIRLNLRQRLYFRQKTSIIIGVKYNGCGIRRRLPEQFDRKEAEYMDENREFSQQETDGEFGRLFRTAFHGFNRQDVVEYIARLTRDRDRDQENAQIRIRELEDARDMLNLDLAAARKNSAGLTAQLYQAQERMEAAQAELLQMRTDVQTRIEEKTRALAAQCVEKDSRIEALERKAALQQQLLLAVRAENALLAQQAQVNAHAAAQYAAQLDAALQAQKRLERSSGARAKKLAPFLQRVEHKPQPAPSVQPLQGEGPRQPEQEAVQRPSQLMETGKAAAAVPGAVQPSKANMPKRMSVEKKWVNTLLSRLLND